MGDFHIGILFDTVFLCLFIEREAFEAIQMDTGC